MNNCKAKNSESVFFNDGVLLQKFILPESQREIREKERKYERKPANIKIDVYKLHNENVNTERNLYIIFQNRYKNMLLHTAFSTTNQKMVQHIAPTCKKHICFFNADNPRPFSAGTSGVQIGI